MVPLVRGLRTAPVALLLMLLGLVFVRSATAQTSPLGDAVPPPWRILSPAPHAFVPSGELFIVVAVGEGVQLDPRTVRLTLDGIDLTDEARVRPDRLSLLYTRRLPEGTHEVRVQALDAEGQELDDLRWTFRSGASDLPPPTADAPVASTAAPQRFVMRGQTLLDTRTTALDGPGSALRQEPARTYVADVDLEGRYGAFTFPLRIYATTDASTGVQRRNRFLVGARSSYLTLLLGDTAPVFNDLMLNGARTRGLSVETGLPFLRVHVVHGELRRRVREAFVMFPTPDAPATALGTSQRMMTAAQLAIGSERTVQFKLNGLRAKDDVPGFALAEAPQENLVAGSDLSVRLWRGALRFDGGAAMSVTTEDISRGAATKAEVDSLFDVDLPFDPSDLDWLITLNASTVPLRVDKLSSLSWYAEGRGEAFGHTISASYRSVGSAFVSFGNPYLRNDRRTLTVADRFRLFDGRLSGSVQYRQYGTLPTSEGGLSSLSATQWSTNLIGLPVARGPRLFASYRYHGRERTADGTEELLSDSRVHSVSLGGYQRFQTGGFAHDLSLFWTQSDRTERTRAGVGNTTRTFSAGLHEQFPMPLYANLQVSLLRVELSGGQGVLQELTTLTGKVGYRWRPQRLNVAATVRTTHTGETAYVDASDRIAFSLSGTYEVQSNMLIELQVGLSTYREDVNALNAYDERFVVFRHRYTF